MLGTELPSVKSNLAPRRADFKPAIADALSVRPAARSESHFGHAGAF